LDPDCSCIADATRATTVELRTRDDPVLSLRSNGLVLKGSCLSRPPNNLPGSILPSCFLDRPTTAAGVEALTDPS